MRVKQSKACSHRHTERAAPADAKGNCPQASWGDSEVGWAASLAWKPAASDRVQIGRLGRAGHIVRTLFPSRRRAQLRDLRLSFVQLCVYAERTLGCGAGFTAGMIGGGAAFFFLPGTLWCVAWTLPLHARRLHRDRWVLP